ncbi:hypothetical protein HS7_13610 [Sulfolobales archaeon HS-7]|nr:hypothetical protein HS7_13610 [Sulfolobales archaeon HS-7]
MKILLISDLHKSYKPRKVDETVAVEWLLHVIDDNKPEYLISAGDWDEGMSSEDFLKIETRVKLLTVYGNHENFPVIRRLAMSDGKIYKIGNLRVAGINGLIGGKGEYSLSPDEFRAAYKRIARKGTDILVMHQPPYLPEVYPKMREDDSGILALEGVREISPKLFVNGHMTGDCFSYFRMPWGTHYLRVDSSQECKSYAILEEYEVIVHSDGDPVHSFRIL